MLTGFRDPSQAAAAVAAQGPSVVAVTGGKEGTWLWDRGTTAHVSAFEVKVLYDIGAGDAFHAGLASAILKGLEAPDAVRVASATAALKISRAPRLTELPTWQEVCSLAGVPL